MGGYYRISFFFFKDFSHLFLERGEGREKEREFLSSIFERNVIDGLPLMSPQLEACPQPRHVPRQAIKPATPWFSGRHPNPEPHQPAPEFLMSFWQSMNLWCSGSTGQGTMVNKK